MEAGASECPPIVRRFVEITRGWRHNRYAAHRTGSGFLRPVAGVLMPRLNAHDTHAMPGPVFSSIDPKIVQLDPIHANHLIDNIAARKTLPGARAVGSPTTAPIPQFDRKHEIMATTTVHIPSTGMKVHSLRPAPAAHC